jgi:hypothetical protein
MLHLVLCFNQRPFASFHEAALPALSFSLAPGTLYLVLAFIFCSYLVPHSCLSLSTQHSELSTVFVQQPRRYSRSIAAAPLPRRQPAELPAETNRFSVICTLNDALAFVFYSYLIPRYSALSVRCSLAFPAHRSLSFPCLIPRPPLDEFRPPDRQITRIFAHFAPKYVRTPFHRVWTSKFILLCTLYFVLLLYSVLSPETLVLAFYPDVFSVATRCASARS